MTKEQEQKRFDELRKLVEEWAERKGIFHFSTAEAQLLKAVAEMGELADAHIRKDKRGVVDGLGDVLVCLINYAAMTQNSLEACLQEAYSQIKDRKGHMVPGGAFVKDES